MFHLPPYQRISLLIKVFLGLSFFTLAARAETLPFKSYTTSDGLAHDFVGEIVRDSRGFLWFCTGEGLSRFDGYEFKNYTQAHGLSHRSVNDLLELEDGIYLVATDDGIAVFNPQGEVNPKTPDQVPMFRTFRVPFETADQRPIAIISLHKTRAGAISAATEMGLYRILREGNELKLELEKIPFDSNFGSHAEVFSVIDDRFGRLWLTTGAGLYLYTPESGVTLKLLNNCERTLLEDAQGRIWVGGNSGKTEAENAINLFELSDAQSPPKLLRRFGKADGLSDNVWFHSLLKTSDGRVIIGIRNGVNEFLPDALPGEKAFRTLFSSDVVAVGEDAGGNLWAGTGTRGAFKLTRGGFTLYQTEEKMPYGGVTSIFAGDEPHEIFATSSVFDLLRFDGEKFSTVALKDVKSRSWSRTHLDFRSRVDGDWWIPSAFGLMRYAAVSKFEDLAQAKPKKIYTTKDGLFNESVFNLYEDRRGDIWISSIAGGKDRFMRWERATDRIVRYTTADGLADYSTPTAFAEDAAGNLWFGFYSGGAARYRNGKFQLFSAKTGFPTGYVSQIYLDRVGRLWIATSNNGAVRFDNPTEDEPRFTVLNVSNGLSSNQANCITEDDFGRIYIGTARGINRVEPETGRIKLYTQADGLPGNAIARCARDRAGDLWFSQKFTIARLSIAAEENPQQPPVFIGSLRANGERIGKISELGAKTIEKLELNAEQRRIQIEFFGLGFAAGETLLYQYRLDTSDWSEPSKERTLTFDLSPGSHNFEVRAVNAEGVTSETPARVSFSIARPLWQRWWFLTALAVLIGLIIYTIYRYRLKRLLELERIRTRIATDLHDDIGSSLSQIAILSEVVRQKVGGNGASEPLNVIADTSREMVDSMSDIVWAINPKKDSLKDLANRMRRFASEVLEAKDIAFRFEFPSSAQDISLGADIRREVYLMFKECVNNLAKHSGATEAELKIAVENNFLAVKILDNGKGFHVPQLDEHATHEGFGGNGLFNLKRRTENLGGRCKIESEIGKGTEILLEIPVPDKKWIKFGS